MITGRMSQLAFPVVLAALALGLWTSAPAFAEDEQPKVPAVGDQGPDFTLPIYGQESEFKLSEAVGEDVIVLAFMQTSCVACRNELILLREYIKEEGHTSLEVYPISVDYDAPERVKSYKKFYKFDFTFLMDPEFTVGPMYGYTYTPALIILDTEGKIALRMSGFHEGDEDVIIKKLDSLLPKTADQE